jgi:DNA mismatch repair protein MutL
MGFRGEALPSIASVSRLVLTTRTRADEAARRLVIEAGRIVDEAMIGAPVGTAIEVADLLHNVPARLKFLRGEPTEAAHITETVVRLAMAHPEVGFRLRHSGRTALEVGPSDAGERVRAMMGGKLGERALPVEHEENGVRVRAWLAAPDLAQTTSRGVQLFAGRRWIRDRALLQAVTMGYGELVPRGRYPVAVAMVDVPGGDIDVNVHPQKLEVRFSDGTAVSAAVRHAVRKGVSTSPWLADGGKFASAPVRMHAMASVAPPPGPAAPRRAEDLAERYADDTVRALFPLGGLGRAPSRQESLDGATMWERARARAMGPRPGPLDSPPAAARSGQSEAGTPSVIPPGSPPREALPVQPEQGAERRVEGLPQEPSFFRSLRYLGQLDRTYLICEAEDELILIDQHAAHERVAFQRLRERADAADQTGGVPVQRLLFPTTVELPPAEAALVADHGPLLASVGFEVEPFGASAIAVKAIPSGLRHEPTAVLRELLGDLADRGGSRALDERLDHVLATIACHSVVRAGDVLGPDQARALLDQMDGVDFRAHCPHGRPVLLRIGVPEIARRFGRT